MLGIFVVLLVGAIVIKVDVDRLVGGIEVLRQQEPPHAKLDVEHFVELTSPIIAKGRCRVGGALLEVAVEALFDDPSRLHDIGEIIGVNLGKAMGNDDGGFILAPDSESFKDKETGCRI